MNNNLKYMKEAIKEAKKAYKIDDVPVGAIIVYKDKIIARGYNQKEQKNNSIKHAEIIAIEKACKKLKTWHLEECILYTTLEPCLMCTGAIIQSRIKEIYYSTSNEIYGSSKILEEKYNNKIKLNKGLCKNESVELLQKFFQKKRK